MVICRVQVVPLRLTPLKGRGGGIIFISFSSANNLVLIMPLSVFFQFIVLINLLLQEGKNVPKYFPTNLRPFPGTGLHYFPLKRALGQSHVSKPTLAETASWSPAKCSGMVYASCFQEKETRKHLMPNAKLSVEIQLSNVKLFGL